MGTFAESVATLAKQLGWAAEQLHEDQVRIQVPADAGETVPVYIRPCGEMHGREVLELSSRGLRLPEEDASKMPLLILALQRNADVLFGHWGLDEEDEASILRVFHSQLTETMDLAELKAAAMAVADEFSRLAQGLDDILTQERRTLVP